jgi:hypothetical protein
VYLTGATGRFERVKAIGSGDKGVAFDVESGSAAEIYSSYLLGLGSDTTGLQIVLGPTVRAHGNTIETVGQKTAAFDCDGALVQFDSNLIGGGAGMPGLTKILYDNNNVMPGPCYDPALWHDNYFWYGAAVLPFPEDRVHDVALADAGVPDSNGNLFGNTVGCYGYNPISPSYVLPSGSACRDRGSVPVRLDGTQVTLDIDGNPRTLGAAPDIGAYEKE